MPADNHADFLIAGQGLAGTFLALALIERGQRVLVADPGHAGAASSAASGLVSPVTGQRLTRAGDLEALLPAVRARLDYIAGLLGGPVHREAATLRYLVGDRPRTAWLRRREDPAYAGYLAPGPEPDSVWIRQGLVVDVEGLLQGVRGWLAERGRLVAEAVAPAELTADSGGVGWKGRRFGRAIFCQGAGLQGNPWFPEAPMRPVKGQSLEGTAPELPAHPVNRRKTLVPLGGKRFRIGGTYDRTGTDAEPTLEGRWILEETLAGLLTNPEQATITRQFAGLRPTTPDGMPLMGRHPDQPRVGLFNGLGSKGLLLGPYYADRLAEALIKDGPVPEEAAWDRFEERA